MVVSQMHIETLAQQNNRNEVTLSILRQSF